MSLRSVLLENVGDLRGVIYTFDWAGDILPMHTHGEEDVHITVVARGSFNCAVRGEEDSTLAAGTIVDWEPGVWHEFVALEDNSRLVNIIKKAPPIDGRRNSDVSNAGAQNA